MPKQVIVINGPARSGKDLFIQICQEILSPLNLPVVNVSSIDEVRNWSKMMGWDGVTKTAAERALWHKLKLISAEYNEGPTKYMLCRIAETSEGLIFLHIREPEEIVKIVNQVPGAKKLHIVRPEAEILENGADNVTRLTKYDFNIDNNGTIEDLKEKAKDFLKQLNLLD